MQFFSSLTWYLRLAQSWNKPSCLVSLVLQGNDHAELAPCCTAMKNKGLTLTGCLLSKNRHYWVTLSTLRQVLQHTGKGVCFQYFYNVWRKYVSFSTLDTAKKKNVILKLMPLICKHPRPRDSFILSHVKYHHIFIKLLLTNPWKASVVFVKLLMHKILFLGKKYENLF